MIGGAPGASPVHDFLDQCTSAAYAQIVTGIINEFTAQPPSQAAKLTGIVFDVENSSFHDGTAWKKIEAAIDANPNMKFVIAIPFYSDYWADGWNQSAFSTFFQTYGSKISEINIMVNDNNAFDSNLAGLKGYMNKAYAVFSGYGISPSKIAMTLDISNSNLTPNNLKAAQTWLKSYQYNNLSVSQGIHIFSREEDNNNMLSQLAPSVAPIQASQ